jgi:hypothetical protein
MEDHVVIDILVCPGSRRNLPERLDKHVETVESSEWSEARSQLTTVIRPTILVSCDSSRSATPNPQFL